LLRGGHEAGKLALPIPENHADKFRPERAMAWGQATAHANSIFPLPTFDIVVFIADPDAGVVRDRERAGRDLARMVAAACAQSCRSANVTAMSSAQIYRFEAEPGPTR